MSNITALQSSVDYVVSKEHDELLKKWVMLGHHFFNETPRCKKADCTSINVLCEQGNLSVDTDSTSNGSPLLSIKQTMPDSSCVDEIQFLATIDQDDAIRLAGILIAWASDKKIHGAPPTPVGATNEDDNGAA